ncbi:MAG: glutaredoxin family protein [Pseudomonadota bacterium]
MSKLPIYLFILFASVIFSANSSAAVSVVECEDDAGNRSFQKTCPPGQTQIGEKKISTGTNSKENDNNNAADIKVTLYVIPDCDTCEEVREFLNTRNISITEKNVNEDLEMQKELSAITGSLQVPTAIIGDEIITGYSRSKFLEVLEAAGYKEDSDS